MKNSQKVGMLHGFSFIFFGCCLFPFDIMLIKIILMAYAKKIHPSCLFHYDDVIVAYVIPYNGISTPGMEVDSVPLICPI